VEVLGLIADVILIGLIISLPLRSVNLNSFVTSYVEVAVVFIYGTICLARFTGQTIGMRLVRTRCVDAVTHVQMSVGQIVRRTGLHSLFILAAASYHYTLYLNPTAKEKILNKPQFRDCFFCSQYRSSLTLVAHLDKRNQTLHDKFANTLIVRTANTDRRCVRITNRNVSRSIARGRKIHAIIVATSLQGRALGLVERQGTVLVAHWWMSAGANHSPPWDVRAVARHNLADRSGRTRSEFAATSPYVIDAP